MSACGNLGDCPVPRGVASRRGVRAHYDARETWAATVCRVGQNVSVEERVIVRDGPLAAPGEWLSKAPHLIRAVLDDRVHIRGISRHKGIIAAVRAIDEAPLQRRRKLWWTIRGGLGLYDPETLRGEAIRVGLLTTVAGRSLSAEPELEGATQLPLFTAVDHSRPDTE